MNFIRKKELFIRSNPDCSL